MYINKQCLRVGVGKLPKITIFFSYDNVTLITLWVS